MANFRSGLFNSCRSDIARALLLSLGLHALLLLQAVPGVSSPGSQRGLNSTGSAVDATLRGMIAAPAVTPAAMNPAPVAVARAASVNPLRSAAVRQDQSSPEVAVERFPDGREAPSLAGAASTAAPSDGEAVDAGGLRQYRLSLALESRRFKRYPQEALEQRWSGTAQLRVAIAASGVPQSVQLVNSSGHEALDAAALEMTRMAALSAAVPASLRGRPFSVPLPVEFRRDPE